MLGAIRTISWHFQGEARCLSAESGNSRDKLGSEQKAGIRVKIENWQFDEIPRECGMNDTGLALFVGGRSRSARGPSEVQRQACEGFVWIGAGALETLPGATPARGLCRNCLWKDVRQAVPRRRGISSLVRGAAHHYGQGSGSARWRSPHPGGRPRPEPPRDTSSA